MSRKLIFTLLLLPLLALAQNNSEDLIFENDLLMPNPSQVAQFEKGLAAHNKKFHGSGPFGARVYLINNGPNTGNYVWVMGPFPWSSMDGSPAKQEEHDADWDKNISPYSLPGSGTQSYWKFEAKVSQFPRDFTIKNLLVDIYDIKRGKGKEAMALIEKVKKVYSEKMPNEIFGIYTNEFGSTKEGRDLAVISFFDKSSWLGEDRGFAQKFDEVHGAGSFEKFIADWYDVTNGGESELWTFQPDLSGISGDEKVNKGK